MTFRSVLLAFALTLCLAAPAHATIEPLTASVDTFNVDISIDQSSLQSSMYKSKGVFLVDTTVTNTSHQPQEIIVWTQYGWSWMSSNKQLSPGTEAAKNGQTTITLKPNESHSGKVEVSANMGGERPLVFQLGFVPKKAELPASGQTDIAKFGGVYWSNPVTLTH